MVCGQRVFLALGANLGDRQGNILQALQYLQAKLEVVKVSSFYETDPVGYLDQPRFLNAVCEVETDLSPHDLLRLAKWVEQRMGRTVTFRNGPRPIDVDVVLYGDTVMDEQDLTIPHPRMAERAFVLVPLAEIAPDVVDPRSRLTVSELAQSVDRSGVKKSQRCLRFPLDRDVQKGTPEVPFSLGRVGVTGLERIIRLESDRGTSLFYAKMDLFADLDGSKAGVHMSRFSEILEEAAEEAAGSSAPDIETMAERLAFLVAERQEALRSEVRIRAHFPLKKHTPISGKLSQEIYTFIGISACDGKSCRTVSGVEVDGLTVCPCAQDMVRSHSKGLLVSQGYGEDEAERIVDLLPLASHNQRGKATLMIGGAGAIKAENLVHLAEASMSSEIYELLKRPDEFFVVNKAHTNPRFVEDVVREMLRNVVEVSPDLPDDSFVLARQENFESIHRHNAFAERSALLGDLRLEMEGLRPGRPMSLDRWLMGV
ncbi:GTP cyclohydrolase MptA [Dethiosulfovibrio salsuginis]|uniref:2-amino-4-hydroxy-6-hydroxymethyldihydropteridine diphosphokinase n=2 Tax=Dethiosulfovibrio salsuginis TaxID=561720 RepID=A0A1X7LCV6_9BACT|nr:GTP cyclohydrolase MptA [Dethiosulfovibrio salsuginis]SMG51213.1 GTP cyclohydrolase-4 [Dethiosulfovibrio salsuginis]